MAGITSDFPPGTCPLRKVPATRGHDLILLHQTPHPRHPIFHKSPSHRLLFYGWLASDGQVSLLLWGAGFPSKPLFKMALSPDSLCAKLSASASLYTKEAEEGAGCVSLQVTCVCTKRYQTQRQENVSQPEKAHKCKGKRRKQPPAPTAIFKWDPGGGGGDAAMSPQ